MEEQQNYIFAKELAKKKNHAEIMLLTPTPTGSQTDPPWFSIVRFRL